MNHKHPKSDIKPVVLRRLRIIEGQMRGLQEMVQQDKYCIDIITQTSATKSALSSVEDILLANHLSTCAADQIKSGNIAKANKEILKVYQLKKG